MRVNVRSRILDAGWRYQNLVALNQEYLAWANALHQQCIFRCTDKLYRNTSVQFGRQAKCDVQLLVYIRKDVSCGGAPGSRFAGHDGGIGICISKSFMVHKLRWDLAYSLY